MEQQNLILLVSIITPLASAAATLIPVLSGAIKNRKAVLDRLNLVIRDVSRLTMHDEHLSLEERIAAGDRYMASGGNGASKVYHEMLADQYKAGLTEKEGV
jgi:hypothetical protein